MVRPRRILSCAPTEISCFIYLRALPIQPRKRTMAKKKKKAAASRNGSPKSAKTSDGEASQFSLTQLPIKRHVPPSMHGVFANHVVIRADPANFHLFFFDAQPPIGLELEVGEKKASELTEVDANCVARVVIPPYVMPGLIQALLGNMEKQKGFAVTMGAEVKN